MCLQRTLLHHWCFLGYGKHLRATAELSYTPLFDGLLGQTWLVLPQGTPQLLWEEISSYSHGEPLPAHFPPDRFLRARQAFPHTGAGKPLPSASSSSPDEKSWLSVAIPRIFLGPNEQCRGPLDGNVSVQEAGAAFRQAVQFPSVLALGKLRALFGAEVDSLTPCCLSLLPQWTWLGFGHLGGLWFRRLGASFPPSFHVRVQLRATFAHWSGRSRLFGGDGNALLGSGGGVLGVVSVIVCLKMDDFFPLRAAMCCLFPAHSSAQCLSDGVQGHWMEAASWMPCPGSLSLWDAGTAGAFLVHHWRCGKPTATPCDPTDVIRLSKICPVHTTKPSTGP